MEEENNLSWDTPILPHKYASAVVVGKTVVLVRHVFADSGSAEEIYNDYINEKVAKISDI